MNNTAPVVLDFDGSQGIVAGATELALADWQEAIRFGCSLTTFKKLTKVLQQQLSAAEGPGQQIAAGVRLILRGVRSCP